MLKILLLAFLAYNFDDGFARKSSSDPPDCAIIVEQLQVAEAMPGGNGTLNRDESDPPQATDHAADQAPMVATGEADSHVPEVHS